MPAPRTAPPTAPCPIPANFQLQPGSHDFGLVPVGMTAMKSFALENTGALTSGTPSVFLDGPGAESFRILENGCEGPLDGQSSCQILVGFAPGAPGAADTLLEAEAVPGGRVSAQLTGVGAADAGAP